LSSGLKALSAARRHSSAFSRYSSDLVIGRTLPNATRTRIRPRGPNPPSAVMARLFRKGPLLNSKGASLVREGSTIFRGVHNAICLDRSGTAPTNAAAARWCASSDPRACMDRLWRLKRTRPKTLRKALGRLEDITYWRT
jgi:hypothetical protein